MHIKIKILNCCKIGKKSTKYYAACKLKDYYNNVYKYIDYYLKQTFFIHFILPIIQALKYVSSGDYLMKCNKNTNGRH